MTDTYKQIKAKLTLRENIPVAKNIYQMRLYGDFAPMLPGQFVNIKIDGLFLRRPISVCDCAAGELTIIYKTVGEGTLALSRLTAGACVDLLTGLGNGFDTSRAGSRPLLIGGGVGIPPLYYLAKTLTAAGNPPVAVLGFNSKEESFYVDEFSALCSDVYVATADGSLGTRGFVTDAIKENNLVGFSYYYSCGPKGMLKAVYDLCDFDGEMSFEERMGCGFGACMGCTCKTKNGAKRICVGGPVLRKDEIIFD